MFCYCVEEVGPCDLGALLLHIKPPNDWYNMDFSKQYLKYML